MKRSAIAHWEGSGKEGKGTLTTASKALNQTPYSSSARFENSAGTNPEELIGAAHAGCFTMKLSYNLSGAGFVPDALDTEAVVTLENGTISHILLKTQARVPGISEEKFQELARDAKANCPVSKLFQTEIELQATLL